MFPTIILRLSLFFCSLLCLTSFNINHSTKKGEEKKIAIFFAVNDYQNKGWLDLKTPVKDAESIASVLESKYNFQTEIIRNPSKKDINAKIFELSKRKFEENDQLLIYFSGHGEFVRFQEKKEEGLGYFIPSDAYYDDPYKDSYFPYVIMLPLINNIPCKHILVSIDACYSGSFFNYKNRPGEQSKGEKLIKNVMPFTSRIGLTSGNFEPVKTGVYHSPFAFRFIEALNTEGGEDYVLTATELYSFLEDLSPRPQKGYFGKHEPEGDFLFVSSKQKEDNNIVGLTFNKKESVNQNQLQFNKIRLYEIPLTLENKSICLIDQQAIKPFMNIQSIFGGVKNYPTNEVYSKELEQYFEDSIDISFNKNNKITSVSVIDQIEDGDTIKNTYSFRYDEFGKLLMTADMSDYPIGDGTSEYFYYENGLLKAIYNEGPWGSGYFEYFEYEIDYSLSKHIVRDGNLSEGGGGFTEKITKYGRDGSIGYIQFAQYETVLNNTTTESVKNYYNYYETLRSRGNKNQEVFKFNLVWDYRSHESFEQNYNRYKLALQEVDDWR